MQVYVDSGLVVLTNPWFPVQGEAALVPSRQDWSSDPVVSKGCSETHGVLCAASPDLRMPSKAKKVTFIFLRGGQPELMYLCL